MGRAQRKEMDPPSNGQLVECRGSTWRYLGKKRGFWELELIIEGAQFTETVVKVWVLPQLEAANIRLLDNAQALAPSPSRQQQAKGKLFKPFIAARQNHSLHDASDSSHPHTAMHCAIDHKSWQFEPWQRLVGELAFPRPTSNDGSRPTNHFPSVLVLIFDEYGVS